MAASSALHTPAGAPDKEKIVNHRNSYIMRTAYLTIVM